MIDTFVLTVLHAIVQSHLNTKISNRKNFLVLDVTGKNRNRKENRLETVEEAETFLSLPYTVSRDFHSRHTTLFNRTFNYYRDTHHAWYESDKHHSGRFC